jgi:DNA-binding transcriptional regulator YdaS (Cro superfamily)
MHRRYHLDEAAYEAAMSAFRAAVAKVGGQVATANICRCTQGNISQLLSKGSLMPPQYVPRMSEASGIPEHELRPDTFSDDTASPSLLPHGGVVESGAPSVAYNRSPVFDSTVKHG